MTGTEIYQHTAAYERDLRAIRLHAPQWKLLLAYDGQRTLTEVALSAGISFTEALPLTGNFLAHGWIEEQPLTLDQYLQRMSATSPSATAKPQSDEPSPSTPETLPQAPRGP